MEKILLCRTDGIGDLLLVTPLIKEIKNVLKDSFVSVLASSGSKDVLLNNPDVDKIITYPSENLKEKIINSNYNSVYIIYPRFSIAFLMFISKIKKRIGTAYRWYSFLFNKKIKIHRKYNEMHEADYNLKLAEDIIGVKKAVRLFLYLNDTELNFAKNYLSKKGIKTDFFIVYPGGAGSAKNLTSDNYTEIIDRMQMLFPDKDILIASGKNEQDKITYIYEKLKNKKNVFTMTENLSIRELASIIKFSKIFISGSTGPMHIAAALNVKTISFFPEKGVSPVRWGPLGNISEIIIFNEKKINFDYIMSKLQTLFMRDK